MQNALLSLSQASVHFVKPLLKKAVLYNLNTLTQAVGVVVIRKEKHVYVS